jgi:putative transposase
LSTRLPWDGKTRTKVRPTLRPTGLLEPRKLARVLRESHDQAIRGHLLAPKFRVIFLPMPWYRRAHFTGGTYFFTLVTDCRTPFLCDEMAREVLRKSIQRCLAARPFELEAIVLLPDHLHMIWTLPDGDDDFSGRIASIKASFSHQWISSGGLESARSPSRQRRRSRGVWQPRFWEHWIRDETDLARHLDYIHYNPVKHGLATCPHAWPHSSFPKWVGRDACASDWKCVCDGRHVEPPDFSNFDELAME